jgi:hypothetical protein
MYYLRWRFGPAWRGRVTARDKLNLITKHNHTLLKYPVLKQRKWKKLLQCGLGYIKLLSCRMSHCAILQKLTDVSEVLTAMHRAGRRQCVLVKCRSVSIRLHGTTPIQEDCLDHIRRHEDLKHHLDYIFFSTYFICDIAYSVICDASLLLIQIYGCRINPFLRSCNACLNSYHVLSFCVLLSVCHVEKCFK